eukprot:gene8901-1556_t
MGEALSPSAGCAHRRTAAHPRDSNPTPPGCARRNGGVVRPGGTCPRPTARRRSPVAAAVSHAA